MITISTYIWGIRYGFEANHALFPEKVRLDDSEKIKEYDEIVQNFTEEKDSWFRNCNRDFYFMLQNNKYRLYSLVISNHNDIAGRKSFLVFSLVCPTGKILLGDVVGVLNQLKALYKEKNADETINRNLFTADHVNRLVQVLNVVPQTSGQTASNSIFTINSEDQIPKIFREYVGNEVYFIAEGTNAEMIASMPTHFKKRKFGDRIDIGGTGTGGTGTGGTVIGGTGTVGTGTVGTGAGGTVTGGTVTGTGTGGTGAPTVTVPPVPAGTGKAVTFDEKLKKIYTDCETARKNNWKDDITEVEKLISSEPALEKRLQEFHLPDYNNLQNWRAFQAESIGKLVENEFNALHIEIYNSKKDIKKKLDEFHNKVKNLKLKVDALTHEAIRTRITTDTKYHNLVIAKTWNPKSRKPVYMLISIGLILGLVVLGSVLILNKSSVEKAIIDTDKDGVPDDFDNDDNTKWLEDTTTYKLRDYIDTKGSIDVSKTISLCDCWDFPDTSDRKILKCEDNLNWFVYEGKLIEYRMEGSENGSFYSSSQSKIGTRSDNDIEKKHENLFPEHYPKGEVDNINELSNEDLNAYETITYDNKKYRIKKGFTTDGGLPWGNPDETNGNYIPHWRIKKGLWQKKSTKDSDFLEASGNDQKFMNNKFRTIISSGSNSVNEKTGNTDEKTERAKKDGSNNGRDKYGHIMEQNTEADKYWIRMADLNESEFESKKKEITDNLKAPNMKPKSEAGKKARNGVQTKINNSN